MMTVGKWMRMGRDPVGLHVCMEAYEGGEVRELLGTVKAVVIDDGEGFSQRLVVRHFNGEKWPRDPLPAHVNIIAR